MRIITYSDLHPEVGSGWMLPPDSDGDVTILAGDIVTLRDYEPRIGASITIGRRAQLVRIQDTVIARTPMKELT